MVAKVKLEGALYELEEAAGEMTSLGLEEAVETISSEHEDGGGILVSAAGDSEGV